MMKSSLYTRALSRAVAILVVTLGGSARAQTAKEQTTTPVAAATTQPEAERTSTLVIVLKYAEPEVIARVVAQTMSGRGVKIAVDERNRTLVVSPTTRDVLGEIRKLVEELDLPSQGPPLRPQYFSVPSAFANKLMDAGRIVLSERAKVSWADNLIVVLGTEEDHRAFSELVKRAEDARGRTDGGVHGYQISVFFLKCQLGTGKAGAPAAALPEGLQKVATALAESGFQRPQMLAPLTVYTADKFDLHGAAPEIERITLSGTAGASPDGRMAELHITAELTARVLKGETALASGEKVPQYESRQIFGISTGLQAKLGDYLVLAASPTQSSEDAIALVVRVTAAP